MSGVDLWDSFYVIVGSSAGALIGLQFVVMTLIAERPSLRVAEAGAAFGTPTIVHFSAALLLSALLRVPWPGMICVTMLCAIVGLGGAIYVLIIVRRMHRQTAYEPDFEDWLCHAGLPLAAYAMLVFSGWLALFHAREALFGVAGAVLLLLFAGIHNAWDAVTYNVFVSRQEKNR